MALYLVQHGRSLPKESDPEKGLSGEGMQEVQKIAATARGCGVRVARILHSGKKRARQTAEIFAEALAPAAGIESRDGLKPLDDVTAWSRRLSADDNLMLTGHLPFMEKLTSHLIAGFEDRAVMKFQNGGVVCLDQEPQSGAWFIKWALMPNID